MKTMRSALSVGVALFGSFLSVGIVGALLENAGAPDIVVTTLWHVSHLATFPGALVAGRLHWPRTIPVWLLAPEAVAGFACFATAGIGFGRSSRGSSVPRGEPDAG
jgi:hypothetical protein